MSKFLQPPVEMTIAGQKIFCAGFEAGVRAEGGGLREYWSDSMIECEQAAYEEFRAKNTNFAEIPSLEEQTAATIEDSPPPPDAPAADRMIDLQLRTTNIIRKAYFSHTRNEQKAHETAMAVLEEVMRTYEQLAAAQGLPTS